MNDQLLDLVELDRGIVEGRGHLEEREAIGGDAASARDRRPAEEVTLEQVAAGVDTELVIGLGRELLGDQLALVRLQPLHELAQPVAPELVDVELHDVEQLEQRLTARPVTEVVERQLVALMLEVAERSEHVVVELLGLGDLEADETGWKRMGEAADDELP